jgi:hypothetical protein
MLPNMTSSMSFFGIIALSLFGVASAHMKMSSPVPFNVANLDNSPLKADGSDFPCKALPNNPSSYSISAMNKIPVNEPVLLSFEGSATHEGGTCELSISMDKEPTADSVFKVIQVFQGACPTSTGGGLTFNIPKDFPNAERATLAWTWFNKIGNREMYMNCAPIEITGGSDSKDYYESLPDMFKANIPATDCTTEEGSDPTIPNPGRFIIHDSEFNPGNVMGPKCGAAAPEQNKNVQAEKNLAAYGKPAKDFNQIVPVDGSDGTGNGSAPTSSADNGMYTQPAASTAQPTATSESNDGMYTQPVASSALSSSIATAPSATSAPSSSFQTMTIPASTGTPFAYPTLSPTIGQGVTGPSTGITSPSGSPSSGSSQCTTEGAVVCNGPTQWGLCDHSSVVWQAVAAGTICSDGVIKKRSSYVRRHAHGVHKVRTS